MQATTRFDHQTIGHFFGVIQIGGIIDKDELKSRSMNGFDLSQHQTRSRQQRSADPGDPEREAEAIRSKEGIPL